MTTKQLHERGKKTGRWVPPLDIRAARIAALQSSHKSLHAFILSQGYPLGTAWEAMRGKFNGPKARKIVECVKRVFAV